MTDTTQDKTLKSSTREQAAGSAKTGPGNNKKPPTLSDIAARMNLEGKDKDSASKDKDAGSASSDSRPRLGLTGRLNTSSSGQGGSTPSTNESTSDIQSPVEINPSATNDSQSRTSRSGIAEPSVSRSDSPEKSKTRGKGLPSLEDIQARMSKKSFSKDGSTFESDSKADHSSKLGKDPETNSSLGSTNGSSSSTTTTSATSTSQSKPTPAPALNTSPPKASGLAAAAEIPSSPTKSSASMNKPAMPAVKIIGEKPSNEQIKKAATNPANPRELIGEDGKKLHPLQHKWTLYFDSKSFNPSTSAQSTPASTPRIDGSPLPPSSGAPATPVAPAGSEQSYEAALKKLGVYNSVESFFGTYTTLKRPSTLEKSSNYHLFKDGIKPMWEDPANANGGKWTVLFKGTNPALLDRSWMWLVLALVGEELDENDDITGAVCSARPKGDRITLWLRSKTDVELINRLGRKLAHLLDIENEPGVSMDFSMHSGHSYGGANNSNSKFIHIHNPPLNAPAANFQNQGGNYHHHQSSGVLGNQGISTPGVGVNRPNFAPRRGSEQTLGSGLNHHQQHIPFSNQSSPSKGSQTGGLGMSLGIGRGGPIGRSSSPVGGHSSPSLNRMNSQSSNRGSSMDLESGGSGGLSGGVSLGGGKAK